MRGTTIALLAALTLAGAAPAIAQEDPAGALRAAGVAGEQPDGYMGVIAGAPADTQARVDQINIRRKAFYTDLATRRGVTVQDVAESTACTLIAERVQTGQFYKTEAGAWVRRDGAPALPARCPT